MTVKMGESAGMGKYLIPLTTRGGSVLMGQSVWTTGEGSVLMEQWVLLEMLLTQLTMRGGSVLMGQLEQ